MNRYLCDTSCLVAAVCTWHEHHVRTREEIERRLASDCELVLASHSLAETYAVLTRLPPPHRLKGSDAKALLESNWTQTEVAHLTGPETWRALKETERRGITGGQTYDALIVIAALKARAEELVTWNMRNFKPFQNDIEIVTPR